MSILTRLAPAGTLLTLALASADAVHARVRDESTDFARIIIAFDGRGGEAELERQALALADSNGVIDSYFAFASTGPAPTDAQALLLERTVELFGSERVVHFVRENSAASPDDVWRRIALELLGLHVGSDDVSLLAELALTRESGVDARPSLVEPFQSALTRVLEREGVHTRELSWLVEAAEPLRGAVLRAVGASGDSAGLPWLALGVDDSELGSTALQEIGRLARRASSDDAAETAKHLERLLGSSELAARKHMIRILGDLGRTTSIPPLIRVLAHAETSGERTMAHAALRRITRLGLPARADVWADWCREEQRWFEESGAAAIERLSAENDALVVATIQELSAHPLHRDQLARALAPLVSDHASASVRRQVCAALGRLGSDVAVQELEVALANEDEHETVRDAASSALRQLGRSETVARARAN